MQKAIIALAVIAATVGLVVFSLSSKPPEGDKLAPVAAAPIQPADSGDASPSPIAPLNGAVPPIGPAPLDRAASLDAAGSEVPMTIGKAVPPQESAVRPGSGQTYIGTPRGAIPTEGRSDSVSWSPDGQYLLAWSRGGYYLWSVRTGQRVGAIGDYARAVFHPDGKRIVATSEQAISLIDVASRALVKSIPTNNTRIENIRLSANGARLYAQNDFFNAGVCDLETGIWRVLDGEALHAEWRDGAVSPDGKMLALSGKDGKLLLVDFETLAVKKSVAAHPEKIEALAYSPDGKWIATSSESKGPTRKLVCLWDAATLEKRSEYGLDDYLSSDLEFSPGGTMLVAVGAHLYVDDPFGPGGSHSVLDRGGWSVTDAAFSPDGQMLAAVTNRDDFIYIFDLVPTRQEKTYRLESGKFPNALVPLGHDDEFIAIDRDDVPRVINLATGATVRKLGDQKLSYSDEFKISRDGKGFVVLASNALSWRKISDGAQVRQTKHEDLNFHAFAMSPDNKRVFIGTIDFAKEPAENQVAEIKPTTGEVVRKFASHLRGRIATIAMSPDGKWLATGASDAHLRLYDLQSGALQHDALVAEGTIANIYFSPDSQYVATCGGSRDNAVCLWNLSEPEPKYLDGHKSEILGVAFAADSAHLVTVEANGSLNVWGVTEKNPQFTVAAHLGNILSCSLLPAGDGFVTVSHKESNAKVWKVADLMTPPRPDRADVLRSHVVEGDRKYTRFNGEFAEISYDSSGTEAMSVACGEKLAATGNYDGDVAIWRLPELLAWAHGKQLSGEDDVRSVFSRGTFFSDKLAARFIAQRISLGKEGADGDLAGLAFSRDGSKLMTVTANDQGGKVILWNTDTGEQIVSFDGPQEFVDVASSHNSDLVAISSSSDSIVRLFDLEKNTAGPQINVGEKVSTVAIDPAGKHLLIGTDRKLSIYDLASRSKIREQEFPGDLEAIAVSWDGQQLAGLDTSFTGSRLRTYKFADGAPLVASEHDTAGAAGAYFTRDGKWVLSRLAYNANWGVPMFFSAETGRLDRTIQSAYEELYFAADGATLIAANSDRSGLQFINLEDLRNELLQTTISAWSAVLNSYRRDGKYLVLELAVDGRITQDLLGRMSEPGVPIKLDLTSSSNLTDEAVQQLAGNPHIHGLRLGYQFADSATLAALQTIVALPNLQELSVGKLTEPMLAELPKCAKLQVATLNVSRLPPESLRTIGKLAELQVLDLEIDSDHADEVLAALRQLPNLHELSLRGIAPTDPKLVEFRKLPRLGRLTVNDEPVILGEAPSE